MFSAYKETSVKTASQGKLIIMLYDGVLQRLDHALSCFDNGKLPTREIENFNKDILKVQEIITELTATLNMEQGGEIAANLLSLYTYFNQELLAANIARDIEKIKSVREMINDLRQTWWEVVNTNASAQAVEPKSINING